LGGAAVAEMACLHRYGRGSIREVHVPRYWNVLVLALLALLGAACDVRVATEIIVESDYSGTLVVSVAVDDETATDLLAAGLIPDAGLAEVLAGARGWEVAPIEGVRASARLTRSFAHVDDVARLLTDLGSNLGQEDGALWDGLRMRVDGAGHVVVEGKAGLVPPSVAGAVGSDVSFDGEDLARLLDAQGREAVRHDLRIVGAGRSSDNNADVRAGSALVWELPVGEMRQISATLPLAATPDLARALAVGLLVAAATAIVTLLTRRRRKAV
jgi:hypothetical protein